MENSGRVDEVKYIETSQRVADIGIAVQIGVIVLQIVTRNDASGLRPAVLCSDLFMNAP